MYLRFVRLFILTQIKLTWHYFFPFQSIPLNYICPPVFNFYSCFAGFLVKYKITNYGAASLVAKFVSSKTTDHPHALVLSRVVNIFKPAGASLPRFVCLCVCVCVRPCVCDSVCQHLVIEVKVYSRSLPRSTWTCFNYG